MIDNKKIEDAAKSLRKDFNDDVTQGFLVEFGFEKGAKWALHEFLKDLWHPVSVLPIILKRNTNIMTDKDLQKALKLYNFIQSYKELITHYNEAGTINYTTLGFVIKDLDYINPDLTKDIREAFKKALDTVQNEFDKL